jgi:hypothetical protein
MMTLKEIEVACAASQPLDFSRHEDEYTDLPLTRMAYPLGFPARLRTNSSEIVRLFEERWGMFEQQHATEPISVDVHVVDGENSPEGPPPPVYRIMLPLLVGIADPNNYSIVDLARNRVDISVSRDTLRHPLYMKHSLLGSPGCCVATRYATPIHAGCVSLDGHGVLLCGDSGAGKSTLSYACAQAGWTFTSDDGSYVNNEGDGLFATGDHHKVRFRPSAEEFFPEVKGLEVSRRAAGKPSIELPIAPESQIVCAQTAKLDYIVFLNRHSGGPPDLVPYSKQVAQYSMMQTLYGLPETKAKQRATIERLLSLDVLELRYCKLDWAIQRLQKLVRERR